MAGLVTELIILLFVKVREKVEVHMRSRRGTITLDPDFLIIIFVKYTLINQKSILREHDYYYNETKLW